MKFYCYIIQSENTGRLYIGQTSKLDERIGQHNTNQSKYTKNKGPWKILHVFEFETRSQAVQMETKLKKWKSSKRILSMIDRLKQKWRIPTIFVGRVEGSNPFTPTYYKSVSIHFGTLFLYIDL